MNRLRKLISEKLRFRSPRLSERPVEKPDLTIVAEKKSTNNKRKEKQKKERSSSRNAATMKASAAKPKSQVSWQDRVSESGPHGYHNSSNMDISTVMDPNQNYYDSSQMKIAEETDPSMRI